MGNFEVQYRMRVPQTWDSILFAGRECHEEKENWYELLKKDMDKYNIVTEEDLKILFKEKKLKDELMKVDGRIARRGLGK